MTIGGYLCEDDEAVDDRIQALEDELDALHIGAGRAMLNIPKKQSGLEPSLDHADLMFRMISRTPDVDATPIRFREDVPPSLRARSDKLRQELHMTNSDVVESSEAVFARREVEELNEFMVQMAKANEAEVFRLKRESQSLKNRVQELESPSHNDAQQLLQDENRKLNQFVDALRKETVALKRQKEEADEAIEILHSTIADFENQRLADFKLISELRHEFKILAEQSQRTIDSLQASKSVSNKPSWESDWTPNINLYGAGRIQFNQPGTKTLPPFALHESVEADSVVVPCSPSPPWALHDGDATPVTPKAKQPPASVANEANTPALESDLLACNLEKIDLEAFLAKIPPNTSGRTLNERREKFLQEKRLAEINSQISELRKLLKQKKMNRRGPK